MAAIDSPDTRPRARGAADAATTASLMANAIRALAMDAVQQANSGHPGAPMGMAEIAVALWGRHLRTTRPIRTGPTATASCCRNGHGSMLLYALLHLTGYDLPIERAAQLPPAAQQDAGPSRGRRHAGRRDDHRPARPGPHQRGRHGAGREAARRTSSTATATRIVDHHTYVFLGDGCLMEGISHEACALAGAWKLDKLIALYDDNGISIDGAVAPWFIDDTPKRFEAYGWNVIGAVDGHDVDAVDAAIAQARASDRQADADRLQDDHRQGLAEPRRHRQGARRGARRRRDRADARGARLGARALRACPTTAYDALGRARRAARARRGAPGTTRFAAYAGAIPSSPPSSRAAWRGELPADFGASCVDAAPSRPHAKAETVASRKASQIALEAFTAALPELLGGSADLTGSNLTNTKAHAAAALRRRTAQPERRAATSTTACASSAWRRS